MFSSTSQVIQAFESPQLLSYDFVRSMVRYCVIKGLPKYSAPTPKGPAKSYFVLVDKETLLAMSNLTRGCGETEEKVFIPVSDYIDYSVSNEVGMIHECRFILAENKLVDPYHQSNYLIFAPDYQTLLSAQKDPYTDGCIHFLVELP